MTAFLLFGALDSNLAAVIVFASTVVFSLVVVYFVTIERDPKLLGEFFKFTGKAIDAVLRLFKRLL